MVMWLQHRAQVGLGGETMRVLTLLRAILIKLHDDSASLEEPESLPADPCAA